MSEPKSPGSQEDQDQLPSDPQDRAEVEWLLAREENPDAPPPNAALAQEHAELAHMLDTLPVGKPDRGWHDDVLRLIDEEEAAKAAAPAATKEPAPLATITTLPWWRRTAVRISAAGTAVAAAAATTMVLMSSGGPVFKLGITTADNVVVRGSSESVEERVLAVGKMYSIVSEGSYDGEVEIRIFRREESSSVVKMCDQAATRCMANEKAPILKIKPSSPGKYIAVAIKGKSALPENATLKQFRAEAKNADTLLEELRFTAE